MALPDILDELIDLELVLLAEPQPLDLELSVLSFDAVEKGKAAVDIVLLIATF